MVRDQVHANKCEKNAKKCEKQNVNQHKLHQTLFLRGVWIVYSTVVYNSGLTFINSIKYIIYMLVYGENQLLLFIIRGINFIIELINIIYISFKY